MAMVESTAHAGLLICCMHVSKSVLFVGHMNPCTFTNDFKGHAMGTIASCAALVSITHSPVSVGASQNYYYRLKR